MSVKEYGQWMDVEQQLRDLKKRKDLEQMRKFREMAIRPKNRHQSTKKDKVTQNSTLESNVIPESNLKVQNSFFQGQLLKGNYEF